MMLPKVPPSQQLNSLGIPQSEWALQVFGVKIENGQVT